MDILLKKTLEFTQIKGKKNKVKPMQQQNRLSGGVYLRGLHQYQYPIHRNNQRVAFEVQHQPMRLHPRSVTANRRAYTAYTQYPQHLQHQPHLRNRIQTVDELCINEGYRKPKTFTNIAPVLLRRVKMNTSQFPRVRRVSQEPRVSQSPRVSQEPRVSQVPRVSQIPRVSQSSRVSQVPRVLKTRPATRH